MTTTEVTKSGEYTKAQLLAMSGQMLSGNKDFVANLYINKAPEDDEGNELKTGTFAFRSPDPDVGLVMAKKPKKGEAENPVLFRPYYKGYRYEVYDSEKSATVARTIIFTDFKQEIIADNGLLKAGAKSDKLPSTSKARCKIVVFGTVSFKGVLANGTDYEVVNQPVYIKLAGAGFLDYDKLFKDFARTNKMMFQYDLQLIAKHVKEAIYTIELKWHNLTNRYEVDDETIKLLENFSNYVNLENKRIETKWQRIINKEPTAEDKDDPIVGGEDSDLGADLKDED